MLIVVSLLLCIETVDGYLLPLKKSSKNNLFSVKNYDIMKEKSPNIGQ